MRISSADGPEPVASQRHLGLHGRAFRLLVVATVGSFCGYVLLLPLVPLWASRGGAGEIGAGSTTSVFMLTTVLTQLAMPWLLERGGYRWTMVAGSLLLGLPAPLFILTADLGPLIAVSAVRGVGFGMVSVVGAALAVRLVPPGQIGRASGYYGLAVGLPNLVFLSTGVWLALNVGFPVVFWIAGIGPMIGAIAAAGVTLVAGDAMAAPAREKRGEGGERALTWPAGLRLWLVLATPLLVMLVLAVASSGIVTFLAIPLEHAPWVVTAALLGYGAMSVLFRGIAGTVSDRYGRPTLLVPSVVAAGAGIALLGAAVWPAAADWDGPGLFGAVLAVAGAALFGAGFGGAQNDTIVVMFHRGGPPGYGTASAAWNIGYDAGTGVGALGLGVIVQYLGYGPAFLITAVGVLACLPLTPALARASVAAGR
ncbi:MFS family permease [Spinactinospora alkalitolerans]|uniref:MFS family permease n=1 Tax=Spinactinospora alkalitolerans TaxID=687207 RepID=A0A852TYD2_9ACTN|nr:MFS transporter [Spinactinospora alkalitolerans]NYE49556.1 MFS family permease [Spinactinospora alkalitolerans]